MRIALKFLGIVVGIALAFYAAIWAASESGEVVVLTTESASGEKNATRLWVVDHDNAHWLRSGSSNAGWYRQLMREPSVELLRDQRVLAVAAKAEPEATPIINALMNEKYAWADDFIGALFGREHAIAIRLAAISGSEN